jgi:N-acetylmuramoyl-L-alanine amidase
MLRLPRQTAPIWAAAFLLLPHSGIAGQSSSSPHVEAIRFWSFGDVTRVAIQTQGGYKLRSDQIESPARLYFDLDGLRPPSSSPRGMETIQVGDRRVRQIRVAPVNAKTTRVVFDLETPVEVVSSQLVNPDRLMIEIRPKGAGLSALSVTRTVTGSERVSSAQNDIPTAEIGTPPAPVLKGAPKFPQNTAVSATNPTNQVAPVLPPPQIATTAPHLDSPTPGVSRVTDANTDRSRAPVPNPAVQTAGTSAPQQTAMSLPPSSASTRSQSSSRGTSTPVVQATGVASPAKRDSGGDRSLVRVFGLKLGKVVIDAGHGGHDTGTVGPGGLLEKDLVLDIALRLGTRIGKQLGAEVVYTRSDDVFIPLEDRTKIANDQKADLFISIHANSSPEPTATGVETYYFNLTSDKRGLDLATRENATATSSISDLNDLLHRAMLQTKLEESREFAQSVQGSLWTMSVRMNSHSKNRGVRQAPFVVLIGATMPSVLAEIGFMSNSHDERLMRRPDQRQKMADALFKGVSEYASSLSHTQLARAAAPN